MHANVRSFFEVNTYTFSLLTTLIEEVILWIGHKHTDNRPTQQGISSDYLTTATVREILLYVCNLG